MARTAGSRNLDYEEQRLALARRVRAVLIGDEAIHLSMRQLASRAKTSVASMKHYFGDRYGVLVAVMESLRIDGAPHMARASIPTSTNVREALLGFLSRTCEAWLKFHVGRMHAAMLAEGLASHQLGPMFVNLMLEPFLQVGEAHLRRWVDTGALPAMDVRQANLLLMSPVVLALLHQDSLLGAQCRPLALGPFLEQHVDAFLRAYPPLHRTPSA